ncbi:MAG: hypothetical protein E7608_04795 [Ruminococcaceae bacterium]|nr:hypothetical protein [Oscillospiraceae bacterium]
MKKFSKVFSCVFALILLCLNLLVPIQAADISVSEDAKTLSDETITDNLEDENDANLYSFEFTERGDAVILFQSLQKNWTGYTYYWKATVYSSDMAVISESKIKGANDLTVISLDNIEAGTYFVEITPVNTVNPLMGGFTAEPYEMTLFSLYGSFEPEFGKGVQVFDKKFQIIGKIDDTYFIKVGEGTAYGAFYRNDEGAILPMLVSESKDAVNYIISSTGQYTKTYSSPTIEKDGVTYYYTNAQWIDRYTKNKNDWQSENDANYKFIDERKDGSAAEDVLIAVEKAEKGVFMYVLSNYWYWPLIIIVAIGFLAVTSFLQYDGPA